LDTPNLCSRAWINRQYDHEVQGTSLIKPFGGRGRDVPSEAAVLLPVLTGKTGLAMAQVLLTDYGDIDTYHMVTASVEEGYRRVVAVGGDPAQVGGVDNFCWPSIIHDPADNPDGRYKAAQLVRACWGLKEACLALGIPLLSGKDSMYVDGKLNGRHGLTQRVSGPPTMMFTATAPVPDLKRLTSLEPKVQGDLVYALGQTRDELGAGALYGLLGLVGLQVPQTDFPQSLNTCAALSAAQAAGLIASACVVSRGGLAHALARMVLAGGLGLELDLDRLPALPGLSPWRKLFSESTGRLVVTVDPARASEFESLLEGVSWASLGRVTKGGRLAVSAGGAQVVDLKVQDLRKAFTRRFGGMV
jgi:phosphoribosylformylglycinamidine synthase